MQKTITVTVTALGNSTVEANGFQGQGCEAATKPIEDALSGKAGSVSRTFKDEWAATNSEEEQVLANW